MKVKATPPTITSADQQISPAEATALLQEWCSLEQRTSYTTRDANRKRIERWKKHNNIDTLTVTDICNIATQHNILIPDETPRDATVTLTSISMQASTSDIGTYTSLDDALEELKKYKARVSTLEAELEPLRVDKERRKKAGNRYDYDDDS